MKSVDKPIIENYWESNKFNAMKMKNYIVKFTIILMFIYMPFHSNGQSCIKLVENFEIKYSILTTVYDSLGRYGVRKNFVDLPILQGKKIYHLDNSEIRNLIQLLKSEDYDWAANLFLHHLTMKEATYIWGITEIFSSSGIGLYRSNKDLIEFWREHQKSKDVEYWEKQFSSILNDK